MSFQSCILLCTDKGKTKITKGDLKDVRLE